MRRYIVGVAAAAIFLMACGVTEERQELALRYNTPADAWEETLPLGNGRIGMMPDGGIARERIVLNDITMWSGSEDPEAFSPNAIDYLPQIQALLLEGKNLEAQQMMYQHFRCGGLGSAFGNGKDAPYGAFQLVASLQIDHRLLNAEDVDDYERVLSLNDAVATTQFTAGGVTYTREYLASHAHDVLLIRLTASEKGAISFDMGLERSERGKVHVEGNRLIMEGQLNDGHDGNTGVQFLTRAEITHKGGEITTEGQSLTLEHADEAIIVVSTGTDMLDPDYRENIEQRLVTATKINFSRLKQAHQKAYQEKFDRVVLDLGEQDNERTTDERLTRFQEMDDPAFAALYFQYGRYLMISGTRENSLPLNLQGLWANQVQTPWNGDYHLNINVQMNYWPAEVCNLPELHRPLIDLTRSLVPSGQKTAKTFYGAEGWVAHMMTNPWGFTAPGEHASWGATNTGGAWLGQHLWEHYAFSGNVEYLQTIYPVLVGAAEFFLSSMIQEPVNGWLVTAPSSSPENAFYLPGSNDPVYVCMGPTMDVQIITELFTNILHAAHVLGMENDDTVHRIKEALPRVPPMQISPHGCLQEWLEDYEEQDPRHRHVSHLYGLHPSNQISPVTTPELAAAARETLERRGDEGTGWSRAWKINFWARLHNGNRAYKLLKSLLEPAFGSDVHMNRGGGTYPNLFCAHPPFQIDGNFGGTAGIAEMLIQSQDGYIHLLPALPDTWGQGEFKGLRVRGGAEVDVAWEGKKPRRLQIRASNSHTFQVKAPDGVIQVKRKGKDLPVQDGFITLAMNPGDTEEIRFDYD